MPPTYTQTFFSMSVHGRFQQLIESKATTGMCRSPTLAMRYSVSPLEKTDPEIP